MDRRELADFLRSRRARLQPTDVGMPAGLRRRTPGLRREEVATLAAISTDYYTRLEQSRGPHPSRQVLSGLARALRLSDDERAHLFYLAGEQPGPPAGPPRDVPAGILYLLDRLDDAAVFVADATYEVLAWNPLAAALFGDFSAMAPRERNMARQRFLDGTFVTREFGLVVTSHLRAAAAKYPDDPRVRDLIAELRSGSEEFAEIWDRHDIGVPRTRHKNLSHPLVGDFEVDCEVLLVSEQDQTVVLFTAEPGTPGHEALQLLKVVGTQALT